MNLPKRMKLDRAWQAEQFVPCLGTNSNNACQARLNVSKFNRPHQICQIRKEGSYGRVIVLFGTNAHDEKNCRVRKRAHHRLWKNDFVKWLGYIHRFNLYPKGFQFLKGVHSRADAYLFGILSYCQIACT